MCKRFKNIYEYLSFSILEIPKKYKRFKKGIKNIFHWIPLIYKDKDFDYGYLLSLEYEKLKMMYNYFKDANIVVDEWYIALTIKRAIAVLEIVMEEDEAYNKYLNDNYSDVTFIDIEDEDTGEIISKFVGGKKEMVVPVKVNIRNAYRFAHPVDRWYKGREESTLVKSLKNNYGMWAMELRKLKAMHIYYEMRKNYTYLWWD